MLNWLRRRVARELAEYLDGEARLARSMNEIAIAETIELVARLIRHRYGL